MQLPCSGTIHVDEAIHIANSADTVLLYIFTQTGFSRRRVRSMTLKLEGEMPVTTKLARHCFCSFIKISLSFLHSILIGYFRSRTSIASSFTLIRWQFSDSTRLRVLLLLSLCPYILTYTLGGSMGICSDPIYYGMWWGGVV